MPPVRPDMADAEFWRHCNARRLCFQRCLACRRFTHPPSVTCPFCRSPEREWVEAPPSATLFSFTFIHYAAHDSVRASLPYNVAVVAFPECGNVRLVTNVIDAAPGDLTIGMTVFLAWECHAEGQLLPRFRLAPEAGVR